MWNYYSTQTPDVSALQNVLLMTSLPVWILTRCSLEVNWSLTVNTWPFSISLDLGSLVRTLWVGFPQANDCSARTSSLSGMSVSCWISYRVERFSSGLWDYNKQHVTDTETSWQMLYWNKGIHSQWMDCVVGHRRKFCSTSRHQTLYLEGWLLSVVEKHEDSHLEGGDLKDVLPGVGACHLGSSHSDLWPILLLTCRGEKDQNLRKCTVLRFTNSNTFPPKKFSLRTWRVFF